MSGMAPLVAEGAALQYENAELRQRVALLEATLRQALAPPAILPADKLAPWTPSTSGGSSPLPPPPGLPLPPHRGPMTAWLVASAWSPSDGAPLILVHPPSDEAPGTPAGGVEPPGTPSTSAGSSPLSRPPPGLCPRLETPRSAFGASPRCASSGSPLRPPPGLTHPLDDLAAARAPQSRHGGRSPAPPAERAATPDEGAEWRIVGVPAKLRASRGFPLVSPPLSAGGISELRLHLVPGSEWRKQTPAKPSGLGAVRVKLGEGMPRTDRKFTLRVGSVLQGPFTCDFSEREVHECALSMDWTSQMDAAQGSLVIRLEPLDG